MELSDLLGIEAGSIWQEWAAATLRDKYYPEIAGLDSVLDSKGAEGASELLRYAQGLSILACLKNRLGPEFAKFGTVEAEEVLVNPEKEAELYQKLQAWYDKRTQDISMITLHHPSGEHREAEVKSPDENYFRSQIIKLGYEGISYKLPIIHENLHRYDLAKSWVIWASVAAATAIGSYLYATLQEASK